MKKNYISVSLDYYDLCWLQDTLSDVDVGWRDDLRSNIAKYGYDEDEQMEAAEHGVNMMNDILKVVDQHIADLKTIADLGKTESRLIRFKRDNIDCLEQDLISRKAYLEDGLESEEDEELKEYNEGELCLIEEILTAIDISTKSSRQMECQDCVSKASLV
jgi:hypothetical protein